jgi:spore maturation protein B
MLSFGVARGVKVYEVFVDGAKDGFNSAIRIIPYVVAILAAVGMFRASGAMDTLVWAVSPVAGLVGLPPEVIPLALLRPLSGSGAFALTGEITKTYGPDSLIANIAGTMQGTTETTFYVLAVYFGAVGASRTRHAVPTGILSDLSGVLAAAWAVRLLIG